MQDILPSKKKEPLRIDWKLPARLRKPIAHQLKKERAKKRAHNAIVYFEHKKISTPIVWKDEVKKITEQALPKISLPIHHFFNKHVEQHTGDIYRAKAPKIKITLPPYGVKLRGRNRTLVVPKKYTKTIIPTMPEPIFQERDVAYEFAPHAPEAVIVPPKVSLPFSVSVWNFKRIKASVSGAVILFIGFTLASGTIWSLQGAGRGTAAVSSVEKRAKKAFEDVLTAQRALANTDAIASEHSFQAAAQELSSAQKEIDQALASSKYIVSVLDITGTVSAGQGVLHVGTALAKAGEHISRAMKLFFEKQEKKTLTDVIVAARPEFALAQAELERANNELKTISGALLPPELTDLIKKLQEVVPRMNSVVRTLHNESETLLILLGAERDKQYLFLFVNNDEIRPVGGFIGTIGLVNIARGAVENIGVHSVYDGDGQLKEFLAPPNPLLSIVSRWYLRDSNWFVDYAKSAQKAAQLFEKEGGPTVDGVVMLTPSVIKNLLSVTGPIQVPGYSEAVSAENFVKVTQGEVTYNYDRALNKPKQFLSDLTPLLLTKLFASSGEGAQHTQLQTLNAVTKSLGEKDILLYFKDETAQKEAERLGWSGTLPKETSGFLMVNNANIGGHKSDQFIEQEIDSRTTIMENGDADVVVTVRRTHKGPEEKINYPYPDGENPAYKVNTIYQRTLVPKGAILLESKGFTPESDIPRPILSSGDIPLKADSDVASWQLSQHRSPTGTAIGVESGYTFFANWIVTKPGETSVTLTHYRVPNVLQMPSYLHPVSSYSIAVFKQPGAQRTMLRASIQLPDTMKIVHVLPDSGITRESDFSLIYRGKLTSDALFGIVFERK